MDKMMEYKRTLIKKVEAMDERVQQRSAK